MWDTAAVPAGCQLILAFHDCEILFLHIARTTSKKQGPMTALGFNDKLCTFEVRHDIT